MVPQRNYSKTAVIFSNLEHVCVSFIIIIVILRFTVLPLLRHKYCRHNCKHAICLKHTDTIVKLLSHFEMLPGYHLVGVLMLLSC